MATVTDVNGTTPSVTTYRMDGYGRTTSIKDANANAAGSTERTLLAWDSDHNVIRLQEPNGAVSTWEYSPTTGYPLKVRDAMAVQRGLPGIVLQYQTLTGPGHPTVPLSKTSAAGRKHTFTYDPAGNLKTVRNGLNFGPTYAYHPNGTLATVTDANNGLTTYGTYDENGYPQSITDPMQAKTDFVYDVRGNVIQTTDAIGRVTTAEYDAFGRPTAVTTPYQGSQTRTTATGYDLNDNVIRQTAPNGAITGHTFDAADNVTITSLPDNNTTGRQISYDYDPLGRTIKQTAPIGVATATVPDDFVTRYGYDRIGQVIKVETPFVDTDGSTKTPTTTYGYDSVGNTILQVDPNKNATPANDYTTKTVYDLNHRPTAVTDAAGYTSKNEYDPDGLLTAQIDALGHKRRTVYDDAGQPVEVHVPHTPTGSTTQDRVTKTTYDPVGNVTRARLPLSRAYLLEMIDGELEDAVEMDRVLWSPSPYEACGRYCDELFRPALEGLPRTVDAARRCCAVLRELAGLDAALGEVYQDALQQMVYEWLVVEPYRSQLARLDPDLLTLVQRWEQAPEPPAGPATVIDGVGADAGGNPLGVPDEQVGRAWVEVEVGSGTVAVVRYGGVESWALLNVAPESIERVMDLGIGPMADLLWARLPETRPALRTLALRELGAAVVDDRAPSGVPDAMACETFAAVFRAALAGLPASGDQAVRCGRVLTEMIELTPLLGDGGPALLRATVLDWLRGEPHRSALAQVAPNLLSSLDHG